MEELSATTTSVLKSFGRLNVAYTVTLYTIDVI